jgi:hypothetical protein
MKGVNMIQWIKNITWTPTLIIATIGCITGVVACIVGIINTLVVLCNRPVLKGSIDHFITGQFGDSTGKLTPLEINKKKYPTMLLIYFWVTNYKQNPTRLINKYTLYIKTGGEKIKAAPHYMDPAKAQFFFSEAQPGGFDFKRDYLIVKQDVEPITYGSIFKGWVSFAVPLKREEFMKEGVEFILKIEDVFKRKYEIKYTYKENDKGSMYFPISGMTSS